jgi:hypothetical protein
MRLLVLGRDLTAACHVGLANEEVEMKTILGRQCHLLREAWEKGQDLEADEEA